MSFSYPRLVVWLAFWIAACNGSSGPDDKRVKIVQGDFGIFYDQDKLTLTLERNDQVLLTLKNTDLQLGVVALVDDNVN
ncbi:MAG: hypothetical protein JRJ87_06995 [Deltaproteobacteria bacterium]|nr:hypothetical protein [Deltaproteobacteria bacterium]